MDAEIGSADFVANLVDVVTDARPVTDGGYSRSCPIASEFAFPGPTMGRGPWFSGWLFVQPATTIPLPIQAVDHPRRHRTTRRARSEIPPPRHRRNTGTAAIGHLARPGGQPMSRRSAAACRGGSCPSRHSGCCLVFRRRGRYTFWMPTWPAVSTSLDRHRMNHWGGVRWSRVSIGHRCLLPLMAPAGGHRRGPSRYPLVASEDCAPTGTSSSRPSAPGPPDPREENGSEGSRPGHGYRSITSVPRWPGATAREAPRSGLRPGQARTIAA